MEATTGVLALMGAALGVASCEHLDVVAVEVVRVEVEPDAQVVPRGEARLYMAQAQDAEGRLLEGREVVWSTADETIAIVDADGMVSGVAVGTTQVIAMIEGQEGSATVTVSPPAVVAVEITPSAPSLHPGETVQLDARVTGSDGSTLTDRAVTWRSSNEPVAEVDPSGVVRALAVGSATITASVEGVDGTATITVALEPVVKVTVSPLSTVLDVNGTVPLSVRLEGAGGTDLTGAGRVVSWSSSSADVALDPTRGISTTATAVAATCPAGETVCPVTITATSEGVSATATIAVNKPAAGLTVAPANATLDVGESVNLVATVRAADGTDVTPSVVAWTTSSGDVALNGSGPEVTATAVAASCAAGQIACAVTVTATAGGASAAATLVVRKSIAAVRIRNASPFTVPAGTMQGVSATALAADGTPLNGYTVSWTTTDAQIATVAATDPLGATANVNASALPTCSGDPCTTMIVATVQGMTLSDTLVVNVEKAVASITITLSGTTVSGSGVFGPTSITATAAVFAADGTKLSRTVTWSVASGPLLVSPASGDATTVTAQPLTFGSGRVQASAGGMSVVSALISVAP